MKRTITNIAVIFFASYFIACFIGCKADKPPQVVDTIPRIINKHTPFYKIFIGKDGKIKLNSEKYLSLSAFEVAYKQQTRTNSVVWLGSETQDSDPNEKMTQVIHELCDFLFKNSEPGTDIRLSGRSDFSDLVAEQKMLRDHVDKVNKGEIKVTPP
jgi:hypothetical protein